jgi:hypothetical protein
MPFVAPGYTERPTLEPRAKVWERPRPSMNSTQARFRVHGSYGDSGPGVFGPIGGSRAATEGFFGRAGPLHAAGWIGTKR